MKGNRKDVTNYQQLYDFITKNNGVAILDFKTSCAPCQLIQPYLNQYHKKYSVPLATINMDKSDQLASKFNINAIPTYVLIKKSVGQIQILNTVVSAHPQKLKKLFQSALDVKALKK